MGVVHHTLQCLSSAGHHSPRVDSGEAEPMQMEGGRYTHNIAIIILSQEFRIEIANFYMYCICKYACEINVCILNTSCSVSASLFCYWQIWHNPPFYCIARKGFVQGSRPLLTTTTGPRVQGSVLAPPPPTGTWRP